MTPRRPAPPRTRDRTEPPLLPARLRSRLAFVLVPLVVGFGLAAWRLAGRNGPTPIDAVVDPALVHRLGHAERAVWMVVDLGSPVGVAVMSVALALLCRVLRLRRAAVLCLVGAPIAGVLTEWVLKPLVDRRLSGSPAFPSGHTTGAVAVAVILVLLLWPGGPLHDRLPRPAKAGLWIFAVVLGVGVGVGTVVLGLHYATDVGGGAAVAAVVVLGAAGTIDRLGDAPRT